MVARFVTERERERFSGGEYGKGESQLGNVFYLRDGLKIDEIVTFLMSPLVSVGRVIVKGVTR